MSDIIHLLPDHIANQIAAGEVIQRPASVVKEMMENAIDAGARNISVIIKDAGRTLIQIIDDGKGMSETDARMAFERHATSKIATVDDLFALNTMGFRGEALASIAAVSQVELRTRAKGAETGTCLMISGSNLDDVSAIACNEGSVFSVKNLFFNVPARRKFLKSNETEFRHIITEFERVALAYPEIAFSLRHNDLEIFTLSECFLKQRIIDIFGKTLNQKLLTLEANTSLAGIKGFHSSFEGVRKSGSPLQFFFVNGRYMRHPYFHRAVMQAYERMLPAGSAPDYFIYFTIDPATIDVNIHPTKTEIKFENERPVWQILFAAVREALAKSNSVPMIDFENPSDVNIPVFDPARSVSAPQLGRSGNYNPFSSLNDARHVNDDWKALYEGFENQTVAPIPSAVPLNVPDEGASQLFLNTISAPCIQFKNRFIITPLKSGVAIIDQHRAHVRILYERFIANIIRQSAVSQKLVFPEILELTSSEKILLEGQKEDLRYLGFDIDFMGGNSYAINGAPTDISCGDIVALVKEIITAAADNGINLDKRVERLALSLARSTAIRAGKQLTPDEMEELVASLFAIPANGSTPDGLPTLTIITEDDIAKKL
jgi:DNA mismatch repair protein MutL